VGGKKLAVAGLVASQVVLIGGLGVWGWHNGNVATGSLQPVQNAGIGIWVSDNRWHVAPRLVIDIKRHRWTVELTSTEEDPAKVPQDAEAEVVLWGAAVLPDPHPGARDAPTLPPWPKEHIDVDVPPSEVEFFNPDGRPLPASGADDVSAQVFQVTADEFFAAADSHVKGGPAIFDVATSDPPDGLFTQTTTGWVVDVPDVGPGGSETMCPTSVTDPLPAAIQPRVHQHPSWYGATCPAPPTGVVLTFGDNEHLDTSGLPAQAEPSGSDSQNRSTNSQEWTTQVASTAPPPSGHLGGFWINVADPAIAADAQRDILIAGILYGIAGGVLASWIVVGVGWLGKRVLTWT
jgi:hypothetical protein